MFTQLKCYQPRQFVSPTADLRDPSEVKKWYEALLSRHISSAKELEQWLLDRSELEAILDQEHTILYIRMTCQTDDQEKAKAYQDFVENIEPIIHKMDDGLNHFYLKAASEFPLDSKRYGILDRKIKTDIEIFRKENVALFTKLSLLSQEYQKIYGAMTVFFDGKEQTLVQMAKYQFIPDRSLRESAWRASANRRLQDKKKLEGLFDKMLALRHQVARNAGFSNYEDYQFKAKHRFDYTPKECQDYHKAVAKSVVPLWEEILVHRKEEMRLTNLRPWDLHVDPQGRSPLKPFEKPEELAKGVLEIFKKVDGRLARQFQAMMEEGLLDLENRKGKAPGGYQSSLAEARKPFIFMNAVGLDSDVRTLLHESGHAFHSLACAGEPLYDYRHAPMEFNEVASMAMELLAGEEIGVFYKNEEDYKRSQRNHLEDIVFVLAWVAAVDAFQEWIYANPSHAPHERSEKWVELHTRFTGNIVDWEDLEETRQYLWHKQLHIFEVPFYYIEYAIAQLGALQLWHNARQDKKKALTQYLEALSLGGSRPLPQLYETAGIKFDFSKATIEPLVWMLRQEIPKYW